MIRRFLTRIVMVALLAFCGYNWWQMHQMQAEIVSLRAQIAVHSQNAAAPPTDLLAQAQRHADNARAALARSDFSAARREAAAGMSDLQTAGAEQKAGTEQTMDSARTNVDALRVKMGRLQVQANALWRRVRSTPGGNAL